MNMLPVTFLPAAKKYLKKLKTNKPLQHKIEEAISKIRESPDIGTEKLGDLSGVYGYDIYDDGINYELAYRLAEREDGEIVVIIMAGTRENFYAEMKKYIKEHDKNHN